MSKVLQGGGGKKKKENINKLYTDWTVCDKAISSQSIIIT